MSTTNTLPDKLDKIHRQPLHLRKDSSELDVFEAARYFSAAINEASGPNQTSTLAHKVMREDRQHLIRKSIDNVPMIIRNSIPSRTTHHHHHMAEPKKDTKEKKHKQPSSPGGRLASFLNSLFNQTSSRKKKSSSSSSSSSKSVKDIDPDESPGGRRKRRSSISHFRSSSKSIYSSSSSGFRTPPTKPYKEFRSDSSSDHGKRGTDHDWLGEKIKFVDGVYGKNGISEKDKILAEKYLSEKKGFGNFKDDDGAESDSSSDLFELQICDLGYCSSGLPVYETTHMDTIKRGAPISSTRK